MLFSYTRRSAKMEYQQVALWMVIYGYSNGWSLSKIFIKILEKIRVNEVCP